MAKDKLTNKPVNNSKLIERNAKGQLLKGVVLNPNGKPKGSKDFYTDFKEAIINIKDKNTGESLDEVKIIKIALEKMLEKMIKGDIRFEGLYRDLLDRVYGKATQKQEISGELEVKSDDVHEEKLKSIERMMMRFADYREEDEDNSNSQEIIPAEIIQEEEKENIITEKSLQTDATLLKLAQQAI